MKFYLFLFCQLIEMNVNLFEIFSKKKNFIFFFLKFGLLNQRFYIYNIWKFMIDSENFWFYSLYQNRELLN